MDCESGSHFSREIVYGSNLKISCDSLGGLDRLLHLMFSRFKKWGRNVKNGYRIVNALGSREYAWHFSCQRAAV